MTVSDGRTPRELLIEMSQELAVAREESATADRLLDEARRPYEAAVRDSSKARERVKLIEQGIGVLRTAYAIGVRLAEMGIQIEQQPVMIVKFFRPVAFELVAVGPEGTLLYRQAEGMHRRGTRDYAIYADEPPDLDTYYPDNMRKVGLFYWQEHGRGPFGAGTGSLKPKPPPEGGRWRWVKFDEQALLEVGAS